MAASATPVPESDSRPTYNSIAGLFGDWIRQGTEGFVAAQKVFLDLAAQQNALALSIVRERMGFTLPPARKLADFTGESVKTLLDVQRQVLDLSLRQNTIIQAGLKARLAKTPFDGLAEVLHKGFENFIVVQKQLLDAVQLQSDGALDDFGDGKPFDNGRFAELARDAVSKFLDGHKQFLAAVQDQFSGRKEVDQEGTGQPVELLDIAKQSVDAMVETQQHLLDMISEQVKANVTFARDIFSFDANPAKFSEVVKKSVESFVAAQKALVDLAAKQPGKPREDGQAAAA
jgi:hypothetical protein